MESNKCTGQTIITPQYLQVVCFHFCRIYVVANYTLAQAQQPYEIQAKSQPIKYTTLGPPPAPNLKIIGSDLHQVRVSSTVLQDKISNHTIVILCTESVYGRKIPKFLAEFLCLRQGMATAFVGGWHPLKKAERFYQKFRNFSTINRLCE